MKTSQDSTPSGAIYPLHVALCWYRSGDSGEQHVVLFDHGDDMAGAGGGDAPLVRPVPFLPERFVKQASAVLRVQAGSTKPLGEVCVMTFFLEIPFAALAFEAAWRAHRSELNMIHER